MPILYQILPSPPCRAVLLTAKALGVTLTLKNVDLPNGETKTPEYLLMNPQHTVPTLDDNGFYLSESRATMKYLVEKYGKNDSLYPKDLKLRALVDAKLDFDIGTIYLRHLLADLGPAIRNMPVGKPQLDALDEALSFLDGFIGDSGLFIVGKQLTIADISLAVTVSNIELFGHDLSNWKNITRWFNNVKKIIPGYEEINVKGGEQLKAFAEQIAKSRTQ